MEEDLLTWKEKLESLPKGKNIVLSDDDKPQSIYSAIRDNPETFKNKKFSIRTRGKVPNVKKYIIRLK